MNKSEYYSLHIGQKIYYDRVEKEIGALSLDTVSGRRYIAFTNESFMIWDNECQDFSWVPPKPAKKRYWIWSIKDSCSGEWFKLKYYLNDNGTSTAGNSNFTVPFNDLEKIKHDTEFIDV